MKKKVYGKTHIKITAMGLAVLLLTSGCRPTTPIKEPLNRPAVDTGIKEKEYLPVEYKSEKSKELKTKTVDYDYGDRILKEKGETDTPYKLRGILSYPINTVQEKLKLVILLHGCHDNENARRYDVGFRYLTEYLAENGYLAVSIDVNAAFDWKYGDNREYVKLPLIFEEHWKLLKDWNEGTISIDGMRMENRIDFDRIMLLGHSTSGEIIFNIASQEKYKAEYLLCVAPTLNNPDSLFDIPLKGLSILVPEYDGDVVSLDGMAIKNKWTPALKQQIFSTILLKKANHNYFNTVLEANDAEQTGTDISDQMEKEQQRDFLKKFVVMNANAFFQEKYENTIFDNKQPAVNQIDGLDVMTYLRTGNTIKIADANTTYIGNESVDIFKKQDSPNFTKDTAPGLNMALTGSDVMEVTEIVWKNKGAEISVPLEENDVSSYHSLCLDMMVDPFYEENERKEPQGLSVELMDQQGKKQKVVISPESNAVFYPRGKMGTLDLEEGEIKFWDGVTVSSDIRIPMTCFDELDLSKIRQLNLLFDQKEKGAVYLQSIHLSR
ncbi:MAG: hypothetical protein RSA52_10210 [Acetivibrio sp.]